MMFIRHEINKHFVMPIKTNRKIAMSYDDKRQGKYVRVDTVDLKTDKRATIIGYNISA